MRVRITYFKPSGKYYSEGEYTTALKQPNCHVIKNEIIEMLRTQNAPGLIGKGDGFIWLVEIPEYLCFTPFIIPNRV